MSERLSVEELLGGLDPKLVAEQNAKKYKLTYLTFGSQADPCVVVPPGGGSTKEETLFWSRELAAIGPFFVVCYDLRGTGSCAPADRWALAFEGTTAHREMERVIGVQPRRKKDDAMKSATVTQKNIPAPLNPAIANQLHDFDAYAQDAFNVLDELSIEKAHFVGISQGGTLVRLCAMMYPERVLSVVSCSSTSSKVGGMMAAFSAGAEEFYDKVKAAGLYDEDGNPPWGRDRRATREEYVEWRGKQLEIVAPDFDKALYEEMAGKSWDTGYAGDTENGIATLAYEVWERLGKDKQHLEALKSNKTIPIMFVHGRKDAILHVEESRKMFAQTGNCVLELHDYGHNLGPPKHQTALLGRMARFMKSGGGAKTGDSGAAPASAIGTDTYASGVSPELQTSLSVDSETPKLWDAFCSVQTAADTQFTFDLLLEKLQLKHLQGLGLALFLALKPVLEKTGLQFKQKKLLTDLHTSMLRGQRVVARLRGVPKPEGEALKKAAEETAARNSSGDSGFNEILVCGAGPVGLRAACEMALLGFRVTVIEKRPNFSRANILTFWDETMSDILALGAKSYFPNLQPTGNQKFMGTRQIQVCLLKSLLLFGGNVRYGMEISGLVPPGEGGKWSASFRPYMKNRRAAETEANARKSAEREEAVKASEGDAKAGAATEFQKSKDYGGKEVANLETWDVDEAYVDGSEATKAAEGLDPVPFDAYVIAEGGWSDSTRKLGFSKFVEIFKPAFGLVANLKYNPEDMKERNMKSQIHFTLGKDWPLHNCPIQAEFIEYLKGDTHFFALVVSKFNTSKTMTERHLENMKPEDRAAMPDEIIAQLRRSAEQKGLTEMGVFKKSYASGQACLSKDNVDMDKLVETVRAITQEMGLPASTEFFETNPVQLFDFSRRARCVDPVRVLCSSSPDSAKPKVIAPADFLREGQSGIQALVLPVGDALQEPAWTQGLGINRGFHTAMNQAYSCLLAREKGGLMAAVRESCVVHEGVGKMKWGMGHSGLAGSGSGSIGLKPIKEWDTDPRTRLPIK